MWQKNKTNFWKKKINIQTKRHHKTEAVTQCDFCPFIFCLVWFYLFFPFYYLIFYCKRRKKNKNLPLSSPNQVKSIYVIFIPKKPYENIRKFECQPFLKARTINEMRETSVAFQQRIANVREIYIIGLIVATICISNGK